MGPELEYCLKRARQETLRARDCSQPEAALVHQRLAVRYSARAFMMRAADEEYEADEADQVSEQRSGSARH